MKNIISLQREARRLNKIDYKKLISLLQKHKLYTLSGKQTEDTIEYFIAYQLTIPEYKEQKFIDAVTFEIKNTANSILSSKQPRNYTRHIIEKQISDYLTEINKLRNMTVDYKNRINELDTTTDIKKFEKYTAEWEQTQEKINFLLREVNKFKKSLK